MANEIEAPVQGQAQACILSGMHYYPLCYKRVGITAAPLARTPTIDVDS
jgi:hypothetical protein